MILLFFFNEAVGDVCKPPRFRAEDSGGVFFWFLWGSVGVCVL